MSGPFLTLATEVPDRLRADLVAEAGEVVAVVGPNGAGKTTLLRALAGTLEMGSTRLVVAGTDWSALPPHRRSVGLVPQDSQLFPHLSARANVAFGPRARGHSRRTSDAAADVWLRRLGVGELAERRPHQLSGGQAQRVALARALATEPDVLLLDEPFAALDLGVAAGLRDQLRDHLADFAGATLLTTHDAVDVHDLADRVLVLEDGRVAQDDLAEQVAQEPATAHAARLLGLNVLRGRLHQVPEGSVVRLEDGAELVVATGLADGTLVLAGFAPSAVTLTRGRPEGSARNRWPATVRRAPVRTGRAGSGEIVRVQLQSDPESDPESDQGSGPWPGDLLADVTAQAARELALEPGARVWASVKATQVTVLTGDAGDVVHPLDARGR